MAAENSMGGSTITFQISWNNSKRGTPFASLVEC